MDKLIALSRLEARLDRALGTQPDIEFSVLGGMLVGGGLHLGANAAVKRMLKPGTLPQRIGSAIFQKGVRDQGTGRVIHPAVRSAANVLLGPEAGHIYEAGLHSTRQVRKGIARAGILDGDLGQGVRGIVSGKRSGFASKFLNFLPHAKASRGTKLRDSLGGALMGAAITGGTHDWVVPAVNAARTAIADSPLGKRTIKAALMKGVQAGPQRGVGRVLQDHIVSPSLNVARDAGSTAHGVFAGPKRVKGRVIE